jgi:branched-chain amino acid transport system permease protein
VDAFVGYTIAGLAIGAIYAIAATGLVVTYTTSGVFNFAHGATGMLAAFLYWQLRVAWHWSAPAAMIVVILVAAPLYGMLTERILIRSIDPSDTGTALIVTVGLLIMSLGVANTIWTNQVDRIIPPFYGTGAFVGILGNRISYEALITIGLAVAVAIGLRFLFFQTRVGVAMRGVVDDRPLMALNGGYPTRLNSLSWAIGASLAALAGVLQASQPGGGGLQVLDLTFLVVNAFAAALLGRLKSLPLTFAGAVGLGLLVQYVTGYVTLTGWMSNLKPVLPTFFLFAILLIIPPVRLKAGSARVTNTLRVPSLRRSLISAAAFLIGALIATQMLHGRVLIAEYSEGVAVAVVGLSVVLLTGYGGQISLAQYAFMGFGAWLFGALSPGGSILGLVLSSLAFAELAYFLFFSQTSVMGATDRAVPRVHLPGLSLAGAKAELLFECVVFAVFAVAILAVRRGSMGRLLMATRDSSAACATLGSNLNLTKLLLFSSASAIAGVGGALWGGVEREVTSLNFQYQLGLSLVLVVYIWGVASPTGAFLGGLSVSVMFPVIASHLSIKYASIGYVLTGLGAVSLGRNPNGTMGQISETWQKAMGAARERAAASGRAGPRRLVLAGAGPYPDAAVSEPYDGSSGEVSDYVSAGDR